MFRQFEIKVLAILSSLVLGACSQTQDRSVIDVEKIKKTTSSEKNKSEQLTVEAEKLITPISLPLADKVLDEALALDPANPKALLYKKVLAPLLQFKGVVGRGRLITSKFPKLQEKINKNLSNLPNPRMSEYLNMGIEDILTEKDIQEFVYSVYSKLDDLRSHLKNNKDQELELHLPYTAVHYDKAVLAACSVTSEDGKYVLENCRTNDFTRVKLNRADLETLQHMVSGVQIAQSLLTSHNMAGALGVAERFQGQRTADNVLWNELEKNASFGKLESNNKLSLISNLGNDAILGFEWVKSYQKQLCPFTESNKSKKREGYLFADGLCVDETFFLSQDQSVTAAEFARLVEVTVVGGLLNFSYTQDYDSTINTNAKVSALWNSPVSNLRSLSPVFSESSGRLKTLEDKTAGGVLIDADLDDVVKAKKLINVEPQR